MRCDLEIETTKGKKILIICSGSTQGGLVGQVIMAIKNYLTSTGLSIKCIVAQLNFDYSTYQP